jgi:cell wall-associated NlpC family hydrolase
MQRRLLITAIPAALLAACSSTSNRVQEVSSSSHNANGTQQKSDVVVTAMAMLDKNYTYGGKKLHTGFDCSGLVSFVYKEAAGVRINGNAKDIANQCRLINSQQAAPGDLVFFNTLGPNYSHVGIYIGNQQFIHAENERVGVKRSNLSARYWSDHFQEFRTVL